MRKGLLIIINLCVFFVLVVAIELLSYLLTDTEKNIVDMQSQRNHRVNADSYNNKMEAEKYYKHFNKSYVTEWSPYKYWKRKQYESDIINIDTKGVRKTCNQCSSNNIDKINVFVFGGSTVWGTGVEDCETIPSYIAKILNERGVCADVYNFGETGYVSFQETISFLLKLRGGDIPKIAIFYDGVNDVYSSFQNCLAGIPQNEYRRILEFNSLYSISDKINKAFEDEKWEIVAASVANSFNTVRLIKRKLGFSNYNIGDRLVLSEYFKKRKSICNNLDVLSKEASKLFLENVSLLNVVSEGVGVKSLFFLQPSIFFKNKLTDWEKKEADKEWAEFNLSVYNHILEYKKAEETIIDLSNIFKNIDEPVFIDWCHVSEKGNRIVASEISQKIIDVIEKDKL